VNDELEQYRPAIARHLRRMVGNSAEAEDLTQETFLRALRQRLTLRDDAALLGWLYQIATHAALDRLRQRVRMRHRQDESCPEDLRLEDKRLPSALYVIEQQEMSTCVQQYVARLSDSHRPVLLLHDVEGLTAAEIAELLGLSLANVKMRLHRARRALQSMLNEACAFGKDERGVLVCDPKQNH
jgi:RNA polymerase sigma-70 factor, ECF subfamily